MITERRKAILATTTIYLSLSALPPYAGARAERVSGPGIVISLARSTLRLEPGSGKKRRVYPVAVGRRTPDGQKSPLGTWLTGPDPKDRELYLPSRREPAFHRGLPFLRLEIRRRGRNPRRQERPFGIHGPVTPTLIWGTVTAGCIRMRPGDIRDLYRFAVRHPGISVRVIRGPDRIGRRILEPDPERRAMPGCPESALGVRRLRRIPTGRPLHDRICGGVDHWYALELTGGDLVSVRLIQDGDLRVELYGIRAISAILAGRSGFDYKVPKVTKNRGDRYIRVVAPTRGTAGAEPLPYVLRVTR